MTSYREFIEDQKILLEGKKKEKGSFCYMLYLSKESVEAVKGIVKSLPTNGKTIGDYHCTVRYVSPETGKKTGYDGLVKYLDSYPSLPIITAFPKKFSVFGPKNDYLVFELTSLRLHDWYNRVNFELVMNNYPDSNYPEYKPHTSLIKHADLSKGVPTFDIEKYRIPLIFDRHVVTDENEKVVWEKVATRMTK